MLKFRPLWWGLLLTGLAFAGAIAVAVSLLGDADDLSWKLTAVDVVAKQAGEARLSVKGEGLHTEIKSLLIPEATAGESVNGPPALSISLYQFATDGRLAVASTRDHRLLTIDVTDAFKPRVLGGVKLSNRESVITTPGITGLLLIGSKVVICRSTVGLILVDVAVPGEPREVDTLPIRERLLDMQAEGERVYVTSDRAGLFAVTLEDNRLVSRQIPGSRPAARLAVEEGRLVTAAHNGELAFYNLDGQGWPHLSGTLKLTTDIRDLVLAQGVLFVCTADGNLLEFNLAAWPRPALAGKLDLKGRPLKLEWNESTRQLFSTMIGSGVAVIDISRVGKPRAEGLIPLSKMPVSVQSCDNRLFASGINGLRVLPTHNVGGDQLSAQVVYPFSRASGVGVLLPWGSALFIYNHEELQLLSAGRGESQAPDVAHAGNMPFLALPDRDGVRLHAIREGLPTAEIIRKIPVYDEAAVSRYGNSVNLVTKTFFHAGHVYALSRSKLSIFGVDASGRVLSREEFKLEERITDMAWLSGGFLVLATEAPGIQVVDVRRSGAYRVVGEYPLPKYQSKVGAIKNLLVDGTRLYVARARLGVELYDLANPAAPHLLQRIDTPGYAMDLTLYDDLLLAADKDRGMFIVDVSGERALAVGSYRLPTSCVEISYSDNGLYLINNSGGVLRLPGPLRLSTANPVADEEMELIVPSGVAPGRYQLALYDDKTTISFPVTLH